MGVWLQKNLCFWWWKPIISNPNLIFPSIRALLSSIFSSFCQKIPTISQKYTYYRPKKSSKYSIIRRYLILFFLKSHLIIEYFFGVFRPIIIVFLRNFWIFSFGKQWIIRSDLMEKNDFWGEGGVIRCIVRLGLYTKSPCHPLLLKSSPPPNRFFLQSRPIIEKVLFRLFAEN